MGNVTVAVLGALGYSSNIGKKGTSTDITFYNLKKGEDTVTLIEPERYPERLAPLFFAVALSKGAIVVVDQIDATFGECLVMLQCQNQKRLVYFKKLYSQSRKSSAVNEKQAIINKMPSGKYDAVRNHFNSIKNDLYTVVFEDKEIVNHIEAIDSNFESLNVSFSQNEDYTDVTIIAKDAPFQLSRFCSSLSANDANIVDANIFTRDDGVIIDRFKVFDNIMRKNLTETQMKKIESDLRGILSGGADLSGPSVRETPGTMAKKTEE